MCFYHIFHHSVSLSTFSRAENPFVKYILLAYIVCMKVEKTISTLLEQILPLIEKDLIDGAIVSVEEKEFRVRKLPI